MLRFNEKMYAAAMNGDGSTSDYTSIRDADLLGAATDLSIQANVRNLSANATLSLSVETSYDGVNWLSVFTENTAYTTGDTTKLTSVLLSGNNGGPLRRLRLWWLHTTSAYVEVWVTGRGKGRAHAPARVDASLPRVAPSITAPPTGVPLNTKTPPMNLPVQRIGSTTASSVSRTRRTAQTQLVKSAPRLTTAPAFAKNAGNIPGAQKHDCGCGCAGKRPCGGRDAKTSMVLRSTPAHAMPRAALQRGLAYGMDTSFRQVISGEIPCPPGTHRVGMYLPLSSAEIGCIREVMRAINTAMGAFNPCEASSNDQVPRLASEYARQWKVAFAHAYEHAVAGGGDCPALSSAALKAVIEQSIGEWAVIDVPCDESTWFAGDYMFPLPGQNLDGVGAGGGVAFTQCSTLADSPSTIRGFYDAVEVHEVQDRIRRPGPPRARLTVRETSEPCGRFGIGHVVWYEGLLEPQEYQCYLIAISLASGTWPYYEPDWWRTFPESREVAYRDAQRGYWSDVFRRHFELCLQGFGLASFSSSELSVLEQWANYGQPELRPAQFVRLQVCSRLFA